MKDIKCGSRMTNGSDQNVAPHDGLSTSSGPHMIDSIQQMWDPHDQWWTSKVGPHDERPILKVGPHMMNGPHQGGPT